MPKLPTFIKVLLPA